MNQVLPIVRYWIPHIRIISPEGLQAELDAELAHQHGHHQPHLDAGEVVAAIGITDQRETVVALMDAGDLFGEMSLLDDGSRSAMARALEPSVMLLDEPLSNLDAKLRVQTRTQIAALQRRLGTTTVYVTHDQIEAMTMGDRVAVLSRGRLQQVDSPQNLYDHPDNIFVATFIGSPQMNLIAARQVPEVPNVDLCAPVAVRRTACETAGVWRTGSAVTTTTTSPFDAKRVPSYQGVEAEPLT